MIFMWVQVKLERFGLRTGDTVEGPVRAPKEGERYFALLQVSKINFEEPEKARHKIAFDNLTPLYPDQTNGYGSWNN